MAKSTITHTETDPNGNAVTYVAKFRLTTAAGQESGFRLSDGTGISAIATTSSNVSGAISIALENNANVTPLGSFYIAELLLPSSVGGTQEVAITSVSSQSPASIYQSLLSAIPSYTPPSTVPPTILTGNNTYTGTNQFNADVYFKSGRPVWNPEAFGAVGDGLTNDSNAFNTMQANVPVTGGTIELTEGKNYLISSSSGWVIDNTINLVIRGKGAPTGGATAATAVTFGSTGAGGLSAKSVTGLLVSGVQMQYTSTGFTGVGGIGGTSAAMIDLQHSSTGGDSNMIRYENCYLGGPHGASQTVNLVSMEKTISSGFSNCLFNGGGTQVRGKASAGSYCNVISFNGCHFGNTDSFAVRDLGQSYDFVGCTFEPASDGSANAYADEAGFTSVGANFLGCWFGDASAAASPWIKWSGSGLVVKGCSIACSTASLGIKVTGTSNRAIDITGNQFTGSGTAQAVVFDSPSNNTGRVWGNDWQSVPTTILNPSTSVGFAYDDPSYNPSFLTVNLGGTIATLHASTAAPGAGTAADFTFRTDTAAGSTANIYKGTTPIA